MGFLKSRFWIFLVLAVFLGGCEELQEFTNSGKKYGRTCVLRIFCLGKDFHKKEAPAWMHKAIKEDLSLFDTSSFTTSNIEQFWNEQINQGNPLELIRVKILNNTFSILKTPNTDIRSLYIEGGLDALIKTIELPNADFLISLKDSLDGEELSVPIFAFANNPKLTPRIVLMPDFEALSGRNWKVLREVRKANAQYPWKKKINRCIWRGSMTGGLFTLSNFLNFPRSKTISLSLQYPKTLDAKYTTVSQCNDIDAISIPAQFNSYFGPQMSIRDQIHYKYQLIVDGNSCAYSRAYWQFFSNCLIFKHQSNAVQWYYGALIPFMHYVPVAEDMSDLIEKINWAETHETEAQQISLQAQKFAAENLNIERVFQYFYLLLFEYSKLQR